MTKMVHRPNAIAGALAIMLFLANPSPADDRSDLSLAIRQGNLALVRTIVEKNRALVKSADDSGFTPLHIAATAGRVDIITYMLDRGADIEARTAGGQTPLFQTVPLVGSRAFELLLSRGADLYARDNEGRSILQFALSWRRLTMVDLILSRGFKIDVQGAAAQTMLEEAANTGIESLVTALLAKGVSTPLGLRDGTTLLHSAARGGLAKFAERLLKQGARADERDLHGWTPLHIAALYGADDVVRVVIAGGADIDILGYDGRSARHLAEEGGNPSTVALLAAKGAKSGSLKWPAIAGPYLDQKEPGTEPHLFAPGIISSEEHETNIAFAPDGQEICFSRINADQSHRWLLFMRIENGRWTAPEPAPFRSAGADYEGAYSPDGRKLFFASNRPLRKDGSVKRDFDIWVVERTGAGWGEPRNLGPAVNSESNEYMPSADREGNLYFERFGLNVARWRDGAYLPAEKIGPGISNVANPGHPFIAPDGSYILFDARGPGSSKSLLFAAFRLKDGTWSPAFRLFGQADTKEYESCPTISPDGKFLFFGRDHDIYWVNAAVIEKLRPNKS
jgi:ankyrin repeat protein